MLPRLLSGKESACQFRRPKRRGFDLWVGKIPWRRKWQPTPVIWLGKSYGQRSLVGYSPWDHKEMDTTEWLSTQHTVLKMMIKITLCLSYFKRVMFSYFEGLLLLLYVKGQTVDDREAWRAIVQGLQRVRHSNWTTTKTKGSAGMYEAQRASANAWVSSLSLGRVREGLLRQERAACPRWSPICD